MATPGWIFTVGEGLAWCKNVDDFSGALTLMLLNGDRLTKLILTGMNWSKELYQRVSIVHIEHIVLIDALSISEVFSDSYTFISLKRDDPETQKRLWLHYIKRTPNYGLEIWSSVHRSQSSMFKQFDLNSAENGSAILLTEAQEIRYLDRIHCDTRSHSAVLPVNRINGDMELLAHSRYLFRLLACFFLLLSTISV